MNEYLIMLNENEAEHAKAPAAVLGKLIEGRAAYRQQLEKAGAFLDGERLRSSSEGKRVHAVDGTVRVDAGPFADTLGGYCAVKAESLDAAVALAKACPTLPGDSIEVRPVMKGQFDPKKTDRVGKLFAFSVLGSASNEEAWIRIMDRIDNETDNSFTDQFVGGLRLEAPRTGRKLVVKNGKPVVLDGPFLESKEVIGGLFFMRMESMEDAVQWARTTPFVKIGGTEIREVWRS